MWDLSPRQMRTLALILLFLCVAGLFVYLQRRGRAVEEGFVITGTPHAVLSEADSSAATGAPAQALSPERSPGADRAVMSAERAPKPPREAVVHVAGAVRQPGIYRLPPDARANDALKAAGGPRPDALLDAINLAARVEDGTQLYVPARKEQRTGAVSAASPVYAARPAAKSPAFNARAASSGGKLTTPGEGTVNLNTAGTEELQRLPGVGPATAARILEFRKENGPFTAPEQLMDVSGIGEVRFERMRPFVRVR